MSGDIHKFAVQMLTPEQAVSLWGDLRPLLEKSCTANELTDKSLTPEHILGLAVNDQCAIFGCFDNWKLCLAFVVQFSIESDDTKAATILALGGRDLMLFKRMYWSYIVEWLRANDIEYVDTYASGRMAKIFERWFGFTQKSTCVRMPLKEQSHG